MSNKKLRIATYLSPSYPLPLFQIFQEYLEKALNCESYLIVESRFDGPSEGKTNPFMEDEIDIAFVTSTSYLKMKSDGVKGVELLGAAPVFNHPMRAGRPVYFSEVVVHADNEEEFPNFERLKGHSWAYNHEASLSGSYILLHELKKRGTNVNFFCRRVRAGSHDKCLQEILSKSVIATSVDSNVLQMYYVDHPEYMDKLHTVCTWGPLPVHPVVINSRLPAETKDKITDAFLKMSAIAEWQERIAEFGMVGFQAITADVYLLEQEIVENVAKMSVDPAYY